MVRNKEENGVQNQIENIEPLLIKSVSRYQKVSAQEVIAYFSGPAPSGDVTTLQDVMENKWLLIHELVELSELKTMGFKISVDLLSTHPLEVDNAHVTAIEHELKFAKEGKDFDWVKLRIKGINAWLEEDIMPSDLKLRCLKLNREYSK